MKTLETLIRLKKDEIDKLQKELAEIQTRQQKLKDEHQSLSDTLAKEGEVAANFPDSARAYTSFAKKTIDRQKVLLRDIEIMEQAINKKREELLVQFGEQKKFEIVLEQRQLAILNEAKQRESRLMDEVAIRGFIGGMNKKGFTLVELSIVLVIIGLLIGGILAAQSMISTAKVQGFVREINQFDISIRNFQTKYNFLPGDSPSFDAAGNGNGTVEPLLPAFTGEISNFWRHLSEDGFLPDNVIYSNDASTGIKAGVNTPIMQGFKGGNKGKVGVVTITTNNLVNSNLYCAYYIADYSTGNSTALVTNIAGALTPADALAVDLKMDDGKARTATYNGFDGIISDTGIGVGCSDNRPAPLESNYQVSNTAKNCILVIKTFSGNGN